MRFSQPPSRPQEIQLGGLEAVLAGEVFLAPCEFALLFLPSSTFSSLLIFLPFIYKAIMTKA